MDGNINIYGRAVSPAGSGLDLATELARLVNEIEKRKYVTENLVGLLTRWEGLMEKILEGKEVEVNIDGEKVGFKHFVDWAGTTSYKKYLFHVNEEILPHSREEIGKVFCNYTNVLSRRWHVLDMIKLKWLIDRIEDVTISLLKTYISTFPEEKDLEKITGIIEKLGEDVERG